ncbi:hypothetical protein [Albidovulum salinarum]|nr:hypothetical protein [Defluviimonas sp. WL0024]
MALPKWFGAAEFIVKYQSRSGGVAGPTADSLSRHLGCPYKTAYRLKHLLLESLAGQDGGLLGQCISTNPMPSEEEIRNFDEAWFDQFLAKHFS